MRFRGLLATLCLFGPACPIIEAQWIPQPTALETFDPSSTLDTIGVTQLRHLDPTLNGSGVSVAQPEAVSGGAYYFEVNPAFVGQPQTLFTYFGFNITVVGIFPNLAGFESGHADLVGSAFYGYTNSWNPEGVAYGISHVDNWLSGVFYYFYVTLGLSIGAAQVANQSFLLNQYTSIDQYYDNYVATFGTIFVSAVGNGDPPDPSPPSTCYNGIGVAAFGGASSIGPTFDNGRSKPDITAPAMYTSFSTPLVSGAAAILLQGGRAPATDSRTVKALLLNGAIKPLYQPNPADRWRHKDTAPLDTRYGAGVLNVFNSYLQLQGGRNPFTVATTSRVPPVTGGNVPVQAAWDFNSLSSTTGSDQVNHYFFNLPGSTANFTATATLVWNRQNAQASINNLDLFLYRADGTLLGSSDSTVDNVEHLFLQTLPPGRYDLEVFKPRNDVVSATETYALAFSFASVPLTSAVSREMHNGGDAVDVPLPLTGEPGVECRTGGANGDHQIVFFFAGPVTFNRAAVTTGTGSVTTTSGSGTNSITVNLTGVSNAQTIAATLFGVSDSSNITDLGVRMSVLTGACGQPQ